MRDLRRLVVTVVIGSFSLAALMGIIALLAGGTFGETEGRVLLTTIIVGVESVAVLCYLSVSGSRWSFVGAAGAAVSLVAFALALWLTWGGSDVVDGDGLPKTFGIAVAIAASLAQASLLLALCGRTRVGPALAATLGAITVVAVMIVVMILEPELGDTYGRIFGVMAILDVLGTVVLTATGAFGRVREGAGPGPAALTLDTSTQERLAAAARERGVTPSALVEQALDAYLTRR